MAGRRERKKLDVGAPDEVITAQPDVTMPRYKEDLNAFSGLVEDHKDFISGMPSEIVDDILSYLILDHDPERAVKIHSDDAKSQLNPHVLLSLSAMSRHFRAHVDDFCRRHLIKNKDVYHFRTNNELQEKKGLRRSERLKTKPDNRCYRKELTTELTWQCFGCHRFTERRAVMANGVACCEGCDKRLFPRSETMTLTEARDQYDLQDWMLIASRKPHLRAKQAYLPDITYGTVRTGTPFFNGMTISYRFFTYDVEKVARAVHGDVEAHMNKKTKERLERRLKKRDAEHRKLKIRYHEYKLELVKDGRRQKYHRARLHYYQSPECNEGYDAPGASHKYGPFGDLHKRLCVREHCERCEEKDRQKYSPWWREMLGDEGWWDSDSDSDGDWYW